MSKELTQGRMKTVHPFVHQDDFVHDVLAEGSPPFRQLYAPVGTGKSFIIIFLIEQIITIASDSRILVLLSSELMAEQFLFRVRELSPKVQALFVNRKRYREMEAEVDVGDSPWENARIVIVTDNFAKQADVANSLAAVTWDWCFVDESHRLLGAKRTVIENLLTTKKISRLLLLTATPISFKSPPLTAVVTTSWPNWDIRQLETKSKVKVVEYQRSIEEIATMTQLDALSKMFVNTPSANIRKTQMYNAAQSSLSSLEQVISTARNQLAHAHDSSGFVHELSKGAALTSLTAILNTIDEIGVDTKLDAFTDLLDTLSLEIGQSPVCVVSSFQMTVAYLHSALKDRDWPLYSLTASDNPEKYSHILKRCVEERGILVTSLAAIKGLELIDFPVAVLYDLPQTPHGVEVIIGRFDRYGRKERCTFYTFLDTSEVLDIDGAADSKKELLERFGLIDANL